MMKSYDEPIIMTALKTTLRVLFDCHTFDVGWQGTSTYLAGLINALPRIVAEREPDLDLQIICAANDQQAVDRFIHVEYKFELIRTGFVVRNLLDIPRVSRRCAADLVVSQYVRPFFCACPTLCVIHDVLFLDYPDNFSWKYRSIRKLLFQWSARRSSFVSTVSRYSSERIAHHLGIRQDAILVIPNAVDQAFLSAARVRKANDMGLRLLSVSRLERRKRHEWGIDALEALVSRGIVASYTIIGGGDGSYAQELRNAVSVARTVRGLDVELKSGLDFSSLVQEYADADLFLCPSLAEGFGIPVIEAGAAGTPCVSTNGGALAELEGQFSGCMTPAEDREAFIDAVCAVADDIKMLFITAQDSRGDVVNTYSWDQVAHAYVDVFKILTE
ncbi:glycosyltransferase family 4 protein [Prosthecochloris vibrioformis]|nr:glycosyltransferase family 1 protein [Prosthecochloris vibrioformis]